MEFKRGKKGREPFLPGGSCLLSSQACANDLTSLESKRQVLSVSCAYNEKKLDELKAPGCLGALGSLRVESAALDSRDTANRRG